MSNNCIHLGQPTGETTQCPSCNRRVELKLFDCAVYGQCTLTKCETCFYRETGGGEPGAFSRVAPAVQATVPSKQRWAVGVTTVPERKDTYLPRTLASLRAGGFPEPHLFIDGPYDGSAYLSFPQEKTWRGTPLRTYGNWVLGLWELLVRYPDHDRFAMFQDDVICLTNLREYLDRCLFPKKDSTAYRAPGYWNLFSLPGNEARAQGKSGWYESNQRGWGAVGLVFNRAGVIELLSSKHTVERPLDANFGYRKIDGGIVTSMMKAGYLEYVHYPTLVQHIGAISSMGNAQHRMPESFLGESYNALNLC